LANFLLALRPPACMRAEFVIIVTLVIEQLLVNIWMCVRARVCCV
jgi:hypothetical protein